MNNILKLRGEIESRKAPAIIPVATLPVGSKGVETDKIIELTNELIELQEYWKNDTLIGGALISVYHNRIIAKSNRLKVLLKEKGKSINETIKGARYKYELLTNGKHKPKHVFTYFVSLETLQNTINMLQNCIKITSECYNNKIEKIDIDKINETKKFKYEGIVSRNNFVNAIVDIYNVEKFDLDRISSDDIKEESLITLYETNLNNDEFLNKLAISTIGYKKIDNTTYFLTKNEIDLLISKAPYLIAMSTTDIAKIAPYEKKEDNKGVMSIPDPSNEPVIGVLDTFFDDRVYFSKWVEYKCMIDENISTETNDYFHGTCVSSLIVDGPSINKNLDDGCGRFKVKHFGVSKESGFSSRIILKNIRQAVSENPNIKVWNLSLGTIKEINKNFISPEAAEIDKIQNEYDVIFVISGTNKDNNEKYIGAPADSINSIVVNSVKANSEPASYTRCGPVLSFFCKPDVSYYGGDKGEYIRVCSPTGEAIVSGTSFAAPWITRKVAYLIYKLGLTREVAKSLIIDSAAGWKSKVDNIYKSGYGVVPININDIIHSKDDEIKFIIDGVIDEYETYTYNLPIPIVNDKQPFYAKATLVYFPYCNRNQGVDYTLTELDIHFGRVKEANRIMSINRNMQSESGELVYEEEARKLFRKWDNVKHIGDDIKGKTKGRKVYGIGLWGINLKCKERLDKKNGRGMNYGIVITLKEMEGKNRIQDFKNLCLSRGWLVTELNVENQLDIYNKLEQEIELE